MAVFLAAVLVPAPAAEAARVLKVGPGEKYATPCAAFAAARDGDKILIDAAGSKGYRGDVCAITADRLRIVGVNSRGRPAGPHIRAAGQNAEGKAIWVVKGDDTTITNIQLSGARVPDHNGAAIRQEGTDLTLKRVYIHHNEMGLLAGDDAESDIRILRSRFSDNGFGDGYSHNIYVNHIRSLTMAYSHSTRSVVGHLVKSRAATTRLLYNKLAAGRSSYEVDLPNGGVGILVGNSVEQNRQTENSALIAFGEEGDLSPDSRLFVVGNTLVDDSTTGGTAVLIGDDVTGEVQVRNNVVVDFETLVSRTATLGGNCVTTKPRFEDRNTTTYWLRPDSPCLDVTTTEPDAAAGYPLAPRSHYRYPTGRLPRDDQGQIAGAFGTPVPD